MTDNWISYVGPLVALAGLMLTIWWRVEGKITAAGDKAARVGEELAAHKLHTAETYVSKQGLRETKEEIMAAIGGVHQAVENMTQRVDRIVENSAKPATRRA